MRDIIEKRAAAESTGSDAAITLNGREFTVAPYGSKYFGMLLRSEDVTLKTRGKPGPQGLPNVMLEFRSHFLWTRGWKAAAQGVLDWIAPMMAPGRPDRIEGVGREPRSASGEQGEMRQTPRSSAGTAGWLISRVDPSLDLQGWAPNARDFMNFATQPGVRASAYGMGAERREKDQSGGKVEFDDSAVLYRRGGDVEGMRFGRDQIQLRIYNKTDEIRFASGKRWFFDLWEQAPGYAANEGQPERVTRVEFQLRREALKSFRCEQAPEGINTIDDFERARAPLWRYLCGDAAGKRKRGWISLRVPSKDRTRSRWPVCPCWARVRDAVGEAAPVVRVHTRRLRTAEAIAPSLAGYAASMVATLALDSGGDPDAFRKRVAGSDVFGERLPEKLAEYIGHVVRVAIADLLDEDLPQRVTQAIVRVIAVSLLRAHGIDKAALETAAAIELQAHDLDARIRQRMKRREGFDGGGGVLAGLFERVAADGFARIKDDFRESIKDEARKEVYDEAWKDGLEEAIRVFNGG